MKTKQVAVAAGVLAPIGVAGKAGQENVKAMATDDISSCGSDWMPRDDVTIAQGGDTRVGYESAVDKFCSAADGEVVPAGGYLSYATEVFLSGGEDPTQYGILGYVYFEVHNKIDSDHTVAKDDCAGYLTTLSADGGTCSGSEHGDTKGGTYQVGDEDVSYHALGNEIPPSQDALNALYTDGAISAQTVNKGSSAPLDPWPFHSVDNVKPTNCHSHNDYDRNIPLFSAMQAGCISIEADVWYDGDGGVEIGHTSPTSGRTLQAQYSEPLKAILDNNGGNIYPASPGQTISLLIDFKTSDAETLDAVVSQLQPLRDGGYLSYVSDNGSFVERAVTVSCSGEADFDRIKSGDGVPDRDVFYDANLDEWDDSYSNTNSNYASAAYSSDFDVQAQCDQAHAAGLVTRYWDLPDDADWDQLLSEGLDRINVDDMYSTAKMARV